MKYMKLDWSDTEDMIAMEQYLADYLALCTSVPNYPNSLHSELLAACRTGDKKAFMALLDEAFWTLACAGLECPQSQALWKDIVGDYFKRRQPQ